MSFPEIQFAARLLEWFAGPNSEPLMGDLAQQYREGRSRFWFWRQISGGVVLGAARRIRSRWCQMSPAMRFAIAGSIVILVAAAGSVQFFLPIPTVTPLMPAPDPRGELVKQGWTIQWYGGLVLGRQNDSPIPPESNSVLQRLP